MWWCRFNLRLNICMVYTLVLEVEPEMFDVLFGLDMCEFCLVKSDLINLSFYLWIIIFVGIMECNTTIFAGSPTPSPNTLPPLPEPIPSITIQPLFCAQLHIIYHLTVWVFSSYSINSVWVNNHALQEEIFTLCSIYRNLHVVFDISKSSRCVQYIEN